MKHKRFFIVLVLIFVQSGIFAQRPYIAFQHITIENGLSSNIIRSFCKDDTGFMWIGTGNGLNRYNGYSVKTYMPDPQDSNAIHGRVIVAIADDHKGNLWIINEEGLEKYDKRKDKFYHYLTGIDTAIGKGFGRMLIDKITGHIWLTSNKYVTVRFDPENNKTYIYKHDPNDPGSVGPGGVMQFLQEKDGTLWQTSWNYGISRYNRSKDNFTHFLHDPEDSSSIIKDPIYTIASDGKNRIWASTFNTGCAYPIAMLDQKTGKFKRFKAGANGGPNLVYTSNMDLNGNVWFASLNEGLFLYDIHKEIFTKFIHKSSDSETISESVAACLYTDYNNNLWVGTLNKGANVSNLKFSDVTYYGLPYQAGGEEPYIAVIEEDQLKNIWIGSTNGLFLLDKKTNSLQRIPLDKNNPSATVGKILNLPDGNVLIQNKTGIYQIDLQTHAIKENKDTLFNSSSIQRTYKDNFNNTWIMYWNKILFFKNGDLDHSPMQIALPSRRDMFVYPNIYENGDYLWIGFTNSFLKINIQTQAVTDLFDESFIPENIVTKTGFYPQKGNMFIRCPMGRFTYNTDSNKFYLLNLPFLKQDEIIPKGGFYSVDDLYIFTYRGIFLYNVKTGKYSHSTITNYDRINPDIMLKTSNGKIYFSSNNGILSFRPELIEEVTITKPTIVIEEFYLFNKPVEVDKPGSPLKHPINYTYELVLDHTQSVFSFDLTLLNFDETQKNEYAYMLEGFEKDWNYVGARRSATYTNIPAGNYIFKYKGIDKNGNWSFTNSLKVVILPPFWETWWFRLLIFLITTGIIYAIVKLRINIIKGQKKELEDQVVLRTAEIFQQKEEILTQQEKIYEIYNELTDSIQTSKRIQDSILPEKAAIKRHFKDAMVFFRPKDIVSGDFYWMHAIENRVYIAAADCTGHGVSGAFMSFIGNNILNKIIETDPKAEPVQILNQLNKLLIQALHQESENPITKDGMDISLCCFHKDTMELQFAGANNPLYVISKNHLEAIKADKNSIGIQPMGKVSQFTNHSIILAPGDVFYIFSDGLMSQFGSETGQEKFKHTRFRDLLMYIYLLPMDKQQQSIENAFLEWKKGIAQTDDIMILGISV